MWVRASAVLFRCLFIYLIMCCVIVSVLVHDYVYVSLLECLRPVGIVVVYYIVCCCNVCFIESCVGVFHVFAFRVLCFQQYMASMDVRLVRDMYKCVSCMRL